MTYNHSNQFSPITGQFLSLVGQPNFRECMPQFISLGGRRIPLVDPMAIHKFLEIKTSYKIWIRERVNRGSFEKECDYFEDVEGFFSNRKKRKKSSFLDNSENIKHNLPIAVSVETAGRLAARSKSRRRRDLTKYYIFFMHNFEL